MKKFLKFIPLYCIVPALVVFVVYRLSYIGPLHVAAYTGGARYTLGIGFDNIIPFLPEWAVLYVSSYLFWVLVALIIANLGKQHFYRYLSSAVVIFVLSAIIFLAFPTTIQTPEVTGNGIFEKIMAMVYSADKPYNLFPSFHCVMSYLPFCVVREKKDWSWWYKGAILMVAILVFCSTVLVKQHFFVDILAGIAICEIGWWATRYTKLADWFEKIFTKLNYVLHIEKRPETLTTDNKEKTENKKTMAKKEDNNGNTKK